VSKKLTIEKKKDIFLALVEAQDSKKMSIHAAELRVCEQFEITEDQLESIIEEGTDKEWLDELAAA
jgi:hypothetical protein